MRILQGKLTMLFVLIALAFSLNLSESEACTYEEALTADFSGYSIDDVIRILNEDVTEPSVLSLEQKSACLIGDMNEFTNEFDKRAGEIKFEALAAISAVETGYFSSDVSKVYNNVGGIKTPLGYISYATKEEGIQALSDLLNEQYINPDGAYFEGFTIIDIGKHYNPSVHWVSLYVKIRLDMEKRCKQIEFGHTERSRSRIFQRDYYKIQVYSSKFRTNTRTGSLCKNEISPNMAVIFTRKVLAYKKEESEEG